MFTAGAFFFSCLIGWYANHCNEKDRRTYDRGRDDLRGPDDLWILALHTRQDIKFISFLLGGVIVMLGIIADKIK
jgi:hypothetical protein